jgi:hypothetical protein
MQSLYHHLWLSKCLSSNFERNSSPAFPLSAVNKTKVIETFWSYADKGKVVRKTFTVSTGITDKQSPTCIWKLLIPSPGRCIPLDLKALFKMTNLGNGCFSFSTKWFSFMLTFSMSCPCLFVERPVFADLCASKTSSRNVVMAPTGPTRFSESVEVRPFSQLAQQSCVAWLRRLSFPIDAFHSCHPPKDDYRDYLFVSFHFRVFISHFVFIYATKIQFNFFVWFFSFVAICKNFNYV